MLQYEIHLQLNIKEFPKLKEILVLADLVKFAKEKPLPADNELSMDKAISFVELTKPVVKPEVKNDKEEYPNELI